MRVVFAGTPEPAVASLKRLIESTHEVVAVVTRPDTVAGRGRKVVRSPIATLADDHGIPVLQPVKASDPEFAAQIADLAPECCPVVAYGALLPQSLLDIPSLGWVNLHFSVLPQWRGAAPVQAAIAAGDEFTGATTFRIVRDLDAGPVLGVMTERVRPTDTSGELLARLADSGAELLVQTLDALEKGALEAVPQTGDPTYAPKVTVESARVRWDVPAVAVERRIRAVTPAPGAWTEIGDLRIKIGPVHVVEESLPPGQIEVRKSGVFIGTATTAVRLAEIQPQGKRLMPALDWARGARLEPGMVAL